MPEMQVGGMKKSSTVEHIISLFTLARIKCRQNCGLAIQFVDCKKCFASATKAKAYFLKKRVLSSLIKLINSFSNSESIDCGKIKERTSRKDSLKVLEKTKNSLPASLSMKDDLTTEKRLINSCLFSIGKIDSTFIFDSPLARSSYIKS